MGRAFDHHSRAGGRGGHLATKIGCRAGHLTNFIQVFGVCRGRMLLAAVVDSHIISGHACSVYFRAASK